MYRLLETENPRSGKREVQTLGGVSELGSLTPFCKAPDDRLAFFFSAPPGFFISVFFFFFLGIGFQCSPPSASLVLHVMSCTAFINETTRQLNLLFASISQLNRATSIYSVVLATDVEIFFF